VVEFAYVKTEMWGPFSLVAKDDQDSVRLLTGTLIHVLERTS
jgi:hypothetical protein